MTHQGFGRSSEAHRAALVVSLSLSEGVTATLSSLSLKTATRHTEATGSDQNTTMTTVNVCDAARRSS